MKPPLKLAIFVLALFALVAAMLLWKPVKIRYYASLYSKAAAAGLPRLPRAALRRASRRFSQLQILAYIPPIVRFILPEIQSAEHQRAERGERAIALSVVGIDQPGAMKQWWDMARARNLDEFESALRSVQIPMFTVMYADRDGHIMHLFNAVD